MSGVALASRPPSKPKARKSGTSPWRPKLSSPKKFQHSPPTWVRLDMNFVFGPWRGERGEINSVCVGQARTLKLISTSPLNCPLITD